MRSMHRAAIARRGDVPVCATQLALEQNYLIKIGENIMLDPGNVVTSTRFSESKLQRDSHCISANHRKPGITNDFS